MSKDSLKNSLWYVLFESVRIYFSNIDKFFVYMLFPVFGQMIGVILIFALTLGFADKIAAKTDSISTMFLMLCLLALPGLLIFMKAFWDYMIAYVALNSMTEGALTTGKVYDFQSHREVATRRVGKYIALLMVVGFLSLIAIFSCIIPVFGLIPPLILWVYFILVFQVFTFEQDLSVRGCFIRSLNLIKGSWARTFLLMLIIGFFSVYIVTVGASVIFDYLRLTDVISKNFDFIGNSIRLDIINRVLAHINGKEITVDMISKSVFGLMLGIVISQLSLPVRSICFSLWYKVLALQKSKETKNVIKKSKKQKTEEE